MYSVYTFPEGGIQADRKPDHRGKGVRLRDHLVGSPLICGFGLPTFSKLRAWVLVRKKRDRLTTDA